MIQVSATWMKIIYIISENTAPTITDIMRQMNASYTNVFNTVRELESKNILTITKNGRNNKLALTTKGLKVIACINELESLMEDGENG